MAGGPFSDDKGFVLSEGAGILVLEFVTETKYSEVNKVVITSHGYGGNNSCLLLSKL